MCFDTFSDSEYRPYVAISYHCHRRFLLEKKFSNSYWFVQKPAITIGRSLQDTPVQENIDTKGFANNRLNSFHRFDSMFLVHVWFAAIRLDSRDTKMQQTVMHVRS
jgi:hypothetical protein